jgi:hypothetical protein
MQVMKTLHFRQKSGANGQLRLDIPVGKADAECDVMVPGFWEQLSNG